MKRIISIVISGLLIINSVGLSFASSTLEDIIKSGGEEAKDSIISVGNSVNASVEAYLSNLTDIENHWAESNIQELIDKGVFKGYPDGTFRPNNEISVVEFIKSLVASSYTEREYIQGNPWYQVYVDEAVKRNILSEGEFDSLTRPITRYEMALLIARAGEDRATIKTLVINKTDFTDDKEFTSDERNIINTVSAAGIITGYPDGSFGSDKKATRAEASVMLNRYLGIDAVDQTVDQTEDKSVVEQMLENVLASKMVSATSISRIQQLVDKEETIFCRGGSYMEDGVIKVGDYTNFQSAIDNALKIGQVLQPHAEKNNLMVAITGGQGVTMSAKYGESVDKLNRDLEMFSISYYRDVEWANEAEIDGEVYEFDKRVIIGGGLFAGKRLEKKVGIGLKEDSVEKYDEYRKTHIDIDEDVLNAFYDGLRAMDPNRAEALFEKMIADYIYSKTHQYGDSNISRREFFEIDGKLIYQEDVRSDDGHHRYITYRFVK